MGVESRDDVITRVCRRGRTSGVWASFLICCMGQPPTVWASFLTCCMGFSGSFCFFSIINLTYLGQFQYMKRSNGGGGKNTQ